MRVEHNITLQKDVFGPWVAMFFAGCVLYFSLPVEPALSPYWLMFYIPLLWGVRKTYKPLVYLVVGSGLLCGMIWSSYQTTRLGTPLHKTHNEVVDIWGRVDSIETIGHKTRYVLSDLQYDPVPDAPYPKKIRLSTPNATENSISVGDDIWVKGHLNPLPAPIYPGGFDFARNLYFKSIGAIGYAYAPPELDKARHDLRISDHIGRMRQVIGARIDMHLEGPIAALAKALLVGDRTDVEDGQYEEIRRAGLAHIMAISGLHMGMVTGLIYLVFRFALLQSSGIALRINIKKTAAFAGIIAGVGYLLLSGASVSTIRAFIMATVVFLAIILDRAPFSFRSIAVAALIVMVLSPLSVTSAGFQMSFSAVIGLVFAHPHFKRIGAWVHERFASRAARILNGVIGLSLTTIIASLTVAPIAAFHFQDVHLGGLASNLIAIPLMGFWVMPFGLLAMFAMPFGLEAIPLTIMGYGIDMFGRVAQTFSQFTFGHWVLGATDAVALVFYALALISLMFMKGRAAMVTVCFSLFAVFLSMQLTLPPDIIISGEKDVAVYRNDGGIFVSTSRRSARFEQGIWAKMLGVGAFEAHEDETFCDNDMCTIRAFGEGQDLWQVSWKKNSLASYGTIILRLADRSSITSTLDEQGQRPWTFNTYTPALYAPVQVEKLNSF